VVQDIREECLASDDIVGAATCSMRERGGKGRGEGGEGGRGDQ